MTATALPLFGPSAFKTCPVCIGWGVLEATDIFCGAGGSSLGLEAVCCPSCGRSLIQVTQALNHNPLAVLAHNANFPLADHDVHDVQDIPPSRFRRTPILWASPDCTHHAYCRGPKSDTPEADRSRATFRDVVRFTAYHRYDAVIIENVIEAQLWCDVRSHPAKCSCGSAFNAWHKAMIELGYSSQIVHFNSQFALPTPQSRDRMYVVFWRDGLPTPALNFRPPSWCSQCVAIVHGIQSWKPSKAGVRTQPGMFEWGRYGSQYIYRCPTCDSAVAPAVTGAKQILDWGLPMHRIGDKPKAPKTRERIRHGVQRLASLEPIVVQVGGHLYERRPGVRVWSVENPLKTIHGTIDRAVVVPVGGQTGQARTAGSLAEPIGAVTTENHRALIVRYGGQKGLGRGTSEPMQTVVGSDREIGVVIPNREHAIGASVEEPAATVTTAPSQHMLVQVNRSSSRNGKRVDVDRNASPLGEPARTIAGHGELALVAFRNHGGVEPMDAPAHTVCGGGYHHGLLVYNGVPGFVRDIGDSAGTVTGRDKQSLLVPYYSNGVARTVEEPTGTVTTKDREALVFTDADIDECLFRMLQWHELLRAQAPHDHLDGRPYELTARSKDHRGQMRELSNEKRVKMIGNMVSAPVATMLGAALVEILI